VKEFVNSALLEAKVFPVKPISIVILDINMPHKNGVEALLEIIEFYDNLVVPDAI